MTSWRYHYQFSIFLLLWFFVYGRIYVNAVSLLLHTSSHVFGRLRSVPSVDVIAFRGHRCHPCRSIAVVTFDEWIFSNSIISLILYSFFCFWQMTVLRDSIVFSFVSSCCLLRRVNFYLWECRHRAPSSIFKSTPSTPVFKVNYKLIIN